MQVERKYVVAKGKRKGGEMMVVEKKSRWEPLAEFKARMSSSGRAKMNVRTGGLLGVELKAFDTARTVTAVTNADSWAGGEYETATYGLFCPVQGNGLSNRDGARVVVKSILVQGNIVRGVASDQADVRGPATIQIALVQDSQTNGAQLNAEDVYAAVNPCVPGQRVLEYSKRFRVLATKTVVMHDVASAADGANTCSTAGSVAPFTFHVKMNQVVNFVNGAGAGTIADLRDVSFHIIAATSYGNTDLIEYNSRVRYVG